MKNELFAHTVVICHHEKLFTGLFSEKRDRKIKGKAWRRLYVESIENVVFLNLIM